MFKIRARCLLRLGLRREVGRMSRERQRRRTRARDAKPSRSIPHWTTRRAGFAGLLSLPLLDVQTWRAGRTSLRRAQASSRERRAAPIRPSKADRIDLRALARNQMITLQDIANIRTDGLTTETEVQPSGLVMRLVGCAETDA